MKQIYEVTVEIPAGVTVEQMRLYIEQAVRVWRGHGDPDEPLYGLDAKSVKVKRQARK